MKHKQLVFTLIEIMIVISIIGILTIISITSYSSSKLRSRDVARKTSIINIASALEQYKSSNTTYAPQYATAVGAGACQEHAGWDATGLGDCYWDVNYSATSDPMFVTDTANAGTKATSGFLLPYMSKPISQGGTVPSNLGANFMFGKEIGGTVVSFSTDAINYRAQNTYYVVRMVLENKSTLCSDGYDSSITSGYLVNDPVTPNRWREATYPASGNVCNNMYKVFQKSSLSSLR